MGGKLGFVGVFAGLDSEMLGRDTARDRGEMSGGGQAVGRL